MYRIFINLICYAMVLTVVIPIIFNARAYAYISEDAFVVDDIKTGSLVSLKKDSPGYVELADFNSSDRLYGVVQDGADARLRFAVDNSEVSVATSGEVKVWASDINGQIKKGDIIGASWISGVAMKVDSNLSGRYLGVATEDFTDTNTEQHDSIQTPDGRKTVKIGVLSVRLLSGNLEGRAAQATQMERLASDLTGKQVSAVRVMVAFLLFGISLVLCGVFITNAIRGSFLSIGRNPLASASIYSSLVQVTAMSVGILIVGAAVAYAVLLV